MFGFFIDLDHVFGLAEYVSTSHGANLISIKHAMASDIEWKSLMHQPVALVVVMPVALMFTYALPLLSWALHLFMDYAQIQYLGIASTPEMILTLIAATLLVWNDYVMHRQVNEGSITIRSFLNWELRQLKAEARSWFPSWVRRTPAI